MFTVKVSFKNQLRRFQVGEGLNSAPNYQEFAKAIRTVFPALGDAAFTVVWEDDEGDSITVSTDPEFREAVRVMGAGNILKFTIVEDVEPVVPAKKEEVPKPREERVVHIGVRCDECNQVPIVGVRYKCTVRNDFDLCASCEAKKQQPFPMLKLQTPISLEVSGWTVDTGCGPDECPEPQCQEDTTPGTAGKPAIHVGVMCDVCSVCPIVGDRYKCTIRQNFDVCSSCQAKSPQPFPLQKITVPLRSHATCPGRVEWAHHGRHRGGRGGFGHRHHGFGQRPEGPPCGGFPPAPSGPAAGPDAHGHVHDHPHGPGPHDGSGFGPHFGFNPRFPPGHGPQPSAPPAEGAFGSARWQHRAHGDWSRFPSRFQFGGRPPAPEQDKEGNGPRGNHPHCRFRGNHAERAAENCSKFVEWMDKIHSSNESVPSSTSAEPADVNSFASFGESLAAPLAALVASMAEPTPSPVAKPALRFVRDVTYPDGTLVSPGTNFTKIWRVRNDGSSVWPEGVYLANAGGDILADPELKVPLSAVAAGDETNVEVKLQAPAVAGRFVSYYRVQTKEGQNFGQRLWANIVVADEETEWHVVNQETDTVEDGIDSANLVPIEQVEPQAPDLVDAAADDNFGGESKEASAGESDGGYVTPSPVYASASAYNYVNSADLSVQDTARATTASSVVVESNAAVVRWKEEISVLESMGFTNLSVIIPLLQVFADDASASSSAIVERVVTTLLNGN